MAECEVFGVRDGYTDTIRARVRVAHAKPAINLTQRNRPNSISVITNYSHALSILLHSIACFVPSPLASQFPDLALYSNNLDCISSQLSTPPPLPTCPNPAPNTPSSGSTAK